MEPEIYEGWYYEVNTDDGDTHYVPLLAVGMLMFNKQLSPVLPRKPAKPDDRTVLSSGWLFRLQGGAGPTRWGVMETEKGAWSALLQMYGAAGKAAPWEEEARLRAGWCLVCSDDVPKDDEVDLMGCCSATCKIALLEQDGPRMDDYVTADYRTFHLWGEDGKEGDYVLRTVPSNWAKALQAYMGKAQWHARVWFKGDTWRLLDVNTGGFARDTVEDGDESCRETHGT